jgi:hypothetical protein
VPTIAQDLAEKLGKLTQRPEIVAVWEDDRAFVALVHQRNPTQEAEAEALCADTPIEHILIKPFPEVRTADEDRVVEFIGSEIQIVLESAERFAVDFGHCWLVFEHTLRTRDYWFFTLRLIGNDIRAALTATAPLASLIARAFNPANVSIESGYHVLEVKAGQSASEIEKAPWDTL